MIQTDTPAYIARMREIAEALPDTVVTSTEAFLDDIQGQASDLVNDLVSYRNSPDPARLERIIRMARTLKDDLNVLLSPGRG